jgi:hypothetical protein
MGRFAIVPAVWLSHPDIGADELAVLTVLALHADQHGVCWLAQYTIATKLNRSRSWVNRVIARLNAIEPKILDKTQRFYDSGGMRSCLYRLVGHEAVRAQPAQACAEEHTPCAEEHTEHDSSDQEESLSRRGREPDAGGQGRAEVPTDWAPTADDIAWARTRHPNLDVLAFTESFILTCRAKGYRYADLSAAWRQWLLKPKGHLPILRQPETPAEKIHYDRKPHRPHARPHARPVDHGPSLAQRNHAHAVACLERILGRRAGDPPAGAAR